MKKIALVLSLCALLGGTVSTIAATTASATTTATPAAPMSAQNNRMKDCAAQYHKQGIAKSQYRAFMSQCLKKDGSSKATAAMKAAPTPAKVEAAPAAAPTPAAMTSAAPVATAAAADTAANQKDKMKSCNADAKTQGLKGADRKAFMKTCLSK